MGCLKVKLVARYQAKDPVVLGGTEQPEMSSDQNPWLVRLHRVYYTTQIYRDYNKAFARITVQISRFRKDVSIFGPPWTSKRMSVWRRSSAEGRAEAQKIWNLFEAFNRWRIHLILDIDFWRLSDFLRTSSCETCNFDSLLFFLKLIRHNGDCSSLVGDSSRSRWWSRGARAMHRWDVSSMQLPLTLRVNPEQGLDGYFLGDQFYKVWDLLVEK